MRAHRIHRILQMLAALYVNAPEFARSQGFLEGDEPESKIVTQNPQSKALTRKPKRESYLESQEEADARPEEPPQRAIRKRDTQAASQAGSQGNALSESYLQDYIMQNLSKLLRTGETCCGYFIRRIDIDYNKPLLSFEVEYTYDNDISVRHYIGNFRVNLSGGVKARIVGRGETLYLEFKCPEKIDCFHYKNYQSINGVWQHGFDKSSTGSAVHMHPGLFITRSFGDTELHRLERAFDYFGKYQPILQRHVLD